MSTSITTVSAIGNVDHHAFISRDGGATWEVQRLGSVELGEPCESELCYADFYAGHNTVTADADLVYAFDGATTPLGPQMIFVRRLEKDDPTQTWSNPTVVSTVGRMATAPTAEATGDDDIRLWFAERSPVDRWNIWYRSSANGGEPESWSAPVRISDAISGAKYKNADGFLEFYGDYGEIAVMSNGKTIATWGEGFSWLGPGGTWSNIGA